ncbi:MAG: twin-arginine translocase TatA/TatE family subunit [Deltaproteobacteria bacterium]|nr:twin-arginine translocase TatA/TatE family subunit [Deltaproteobacteria bacterium]
MFGISFEELIVLLVLALILFGPEKLPEYAEKLGRLVAKLRQTSQEVTQQFHEAYHDYKLPNPLEEPPPRSFCSHCGQRLEQEFAFCPRCGQRLKAESHYDQPVGP